MLTEERNIAKGRNIRQTNENQLFNSFKSHAFMLRVILNMYALNISLNT